MKLKQIIIPISILLLVGMFYLRDQRFLQKPVVVYTENGFSPRIITIQPGTKVVFKNISGRSFWPASDFHPTHQLNPNFDTKKTINTGKEWSFTFNTSGSWTYHDHLSPFHKGVIRVAGEKHNAALQSNCKKNIKDKAELHQCWISLIQKTVDEKGINGSLDLLASLHDDEPRFRPICHDMAHVIGSAAYKAFINKQDFLISIKTSYCGYGFYHGFSEELLHNDDDLKKAKEFCETMNKKLQKNTNVPFSGVLAACYHGFGHSLFDLVDSNSWGDPKRMVSHALKQCDQIMKDKSTNLGKQCATGVFNALSVAYVNKLYELELDSQVDKAMSICTIQTKEDMSACYPQMVVTYAYTKGTVYDALEIINSIQDEYSAQKSILGLMNAETVKHINNEDRTYLLSLCSKLTRELKPWCIRGIAYTIQHWSKPGVEYIQSLKFCTTTPTLNDAEKKACFDEVIATMGAMYSKDKFKTICNMIEEKYRSEICNIR